ncbi:MAG: glycosyltransferase [Gammaproteobacteria bacterium]|nr:glycosyltransferase [Gammaproteobacteria bacterium]MYF38355.1 glycosyltransferase [Gammaproteobacteria bacterium]
MLSDEVRAGLGKISVIIPVFNDRNHLARLLQTLGHYPNLELIIVDGGSSDKPHEITGTVTLLQATTQGRGAQVSLGIRQATREWIWVLHADSFVSEENIESMLAATTEGRWGRFDVTLHGSKGVYRMIETLMNIRSRLTCICTGDQGMFFRQDILSEVGGFPEQPIMEDVEVSKRLRKLERPVCCTSRLGTSIRKWEAEGVFKTVFRMWSYRVKYFFGASPESLYAEYYR